MPIPILQKWFVKKDSSAKSPSKDRSSIRVGIPKVLNIWNTHQFWVGFLTTLGIKPNNIIFSSDTSPEQFQDYGKGRGTVDCCYPVKCISGHYGELIFGQRKKIHILLSPMIYSLPSVLQGHVADTLACPRVMASPDNIKAGFMKEGDVCAANGIDYVSPFVSLGDPPIVGKQLYEALRDLLDLERAETDRAVEVGFAALNDFNEKMQQKGREILTWCAQNNHPAILVLGRPYHMDPGIGHEIEVDLQSEGYPILWAQYFPAHDDLMNWLFAPEIEAGKIASPYDISDVWNPGTSYSNNTNEILWGAKIGARCPWITCVIHMSSYECGMDQPIYTPTQKIVEASGTLFFKFGDLDSTKPAGGVKIRIQTISHYVEMYSPDLIKQKQAWLPDNCPLLETAPTTPELVAV